ncbi:unnamed protein product [Prunus brigantina]
MRCLDEDGFLHMKHRSISVRKYKHKFNKLFRFAPKLIPNEEEKSQAADRVSKKLNAGSARRRRDSFGIGGPSHVPSKRGGSSSNSAGSGWSGELGSSSGSGRSRHRPTWSQHSSI